MRQPRHLAPATLALLVLVAFSSPAGATVPVVDPTNLVQNTMSAVSDAESTVQQIRSVAMQAEQLANQVQNLEKLDIQNLGDLVSAYNKVAEIIDRTMRLAGQWRFISQNFDEIYGDYGPRVYDGVEFWVMRMGWENNTDRAYKESVETQSDAADLNAELQGQAVALEGQSGSVKGQVAATEMGNKAMGVIANQNALMIDLKLAEMRADQAERLERRRKSEAAKQRLLDRMGRGFGQIESTADPVELKDF